MTDAIADVLLARRDRPELPDGSLLPSGAARERLSKGDKALIGNTAPVGVTAAGDGFDIRPSGAATTATCRTAGCP